MISIKLIPHASNPFPGSWIEKGKGHWHTRLSPSGKLWLFCFWRF